MSQIFYNKQLKCVFSNLLNLISKVYQNVNLFETKNVPVTTIIPITVQNTMMMTIFSVSVKRYSVF